MNGVSDYAESARDEAETLRDRRTTSRERPRPEFFRSTSIEPRKLGFYEIEREDFVSIRGHFLDEKAESRYLSLT